MKERISNNQSRTIQVCRGIAIICVVLIHTAPGGLAQVYIRPWINTCVALFIFLSGYLTTDSTLDYFRFIKKRIIRVLIPYLIWSLIYSIAHRDFGNILFNIFTTKASGHFYYIFVYAELVLLTPLIKKMAHSRYRNVGWLIDPVAVVIYKYFALLGGVTYPDAISVIWTDSFFGWFTPYYLGYLLGNGLIKIHISKAKLCLMYFASIVLQMIESYWWFSLGDTNCGTQGKLSVFLTSAIVCIIVHDFLSMQWTSKFYLYNCIKIIGDYSFGIYFSHVLIVGVIEKIVPFLSDKLFIIEALIVLLISFFAAWFGKRVFGDRLSRYLGLY